MAWTRLPLVPIADAGNGERTLRSYVGERALDPHIDALGCRVGAVRAHIPFGQPANGEHAEARSAVFLRDEPVDNYASHRVGDGSKVVDVPGRLIGTGSIGPGGRRH